MSALKKEQNENDLNDELDFDVNDDWRKDADATQTNIFKEEDLEMAEDELDTSSLSLDLNNEIAKKSAAEHAKEMAKKSRMGKSKKGSTETLKLLQEAAAGENVSSDADEMEILTEEDNALVNDPIFTNKGHDYPQIHGNYFLLDHLVDGGMAKVCRARYLGEGDEADKMVAIKMVQEKFSEDDDFVQMFIDEIKVSFGLNHPNINTTFDYGKIGKNLFVSMEYIHGKDLMDVIDELKEQGKTLPIPMAIFIASKMCEGLHYAHNFTNKLTGKKYNIVHRDISPHNAMVSYEGYVKVIDFGIAKADTNETKEEEGTVKGKINYFAPEYLEGKKIDHRYDQFAVALTLWEMLTGEKTFTGKDQISTLKTILACQPEKASVKNKEVPKELDKIIMKALSRDPANRYKDMQAFNRDLMKTLYKLYPDFHESDIAELMTTIFKESYEKDLEKFKSFGEYSIGEIVQKISAFKEFQKRQKEKAEQKSGKGAEMVFDFGFEEEAVTARSSKNGLDSLVSKKKKKKKPGDSLQKNYKKQQKALAAMLQDEDEDDKKPASPLEQHRSLIFLLVIVTIGYFQKETILGLIDGVNPEIIEAQPQQVVERVKRKSSINKSNQKFLNQLKDKKKKSQKAPVVKTVPTQASMAKKAVATKPIVKKSPKPKGEIVDFNEAKKVLEQVKKLDNPKEGSLAKESNGETQDKTVSGVSNTEAFLNESPSEQQSPTQSSQKSAEAVVPGGKASAQELESPDVAQELARLKAQMNALIEKEETPEEKAKREMQAKLEAEELKRKMAQRLNEIDTEEATEEEPVRAPATEEGSGAVDNVINFIKTRKAFSWMFK